MGSALKFISLSIITPYVDINILQSAPIGTFIAILSITQIFLIQFINHIFKERVLLNIPTTVKTVAACDGQSSEFGFDF